MHFLLLSMAWSAGSTAIAPAPAVVSSPTTASGTLVARSAKAGLLQCRLASKPKANKSKFGATPVRHAAVAPSRSLPKSKARSEAGCVLPGLDSGAATTAQAALPILAAPVAGAKGLMAAVAALGGTAGAGAAGVSSGSPQNRLPISPD